jgi:hypothetical protein
MKKKEQECQKILELQEGQVVIGGHEEEGAGMPGYSRLTGRPSSDRRT